ncbi:MAG TPA: hypothetical protein VK586_09810 [Streptosporangiaceae bacterium]|nr:hypothetical protein [Streptosporangiaceae bacterium]
MTGTASAGAGLAPAMVDGVDVDAVAAAARGCAAVDDLCSGAWGAMVCYLPGRQVPGVRVASDHVAVSVRSRWGIPAAELARQVRVALVPLTGARRIEVMIADVADPAAAAAEPDEVKPWMTSRTAGPPAARSSGLVTPTGAAIPQPLLLAWPASTRGRPRPPFPWP